MAKSLGKVYPDLLPQTRQALIETGLPYIIENVVGAPMRFPVIVCGSAFHLPIRRHRQFESNCLLFGTQCDHGWQKRADMQYPSCFRRRSRKRGGPVTAARTTSTVVQVYGNTAGKGLWPQAMGIDWMTSKELSQAIPPAFTKYLGHQFIRHVREAMK